MWLAKLVGLRYMTQVSDSQNPSPHCTAQSVVIFVWWLAPCLPGDDVTCHVSRVPTCDHCNMCPPCGRRPVMAVMDSPTSKFYTNGHQGHSSSTATSSATNTDPLQLLNIFYTKNPYLGEENEQHQNGTIIHIYLVFKKYGKFLGLIDNQRSQYLWHQKTAIYLFCCAALNQTTHLVSKCPIWGSPSPSFIVDGTAASLYSLTEDPRLPGSEGSTGAGTGEQLSRYIAGARPQECTSLVNWQSSPNGVFGQW